MKRVENGIVSIEHELFSASILLQGAQIINFAPQGKENIFWHADLSHRKDGKAFRGGVPICWPWFNKIASPSHGFARISQWELSHYEENSDGVEVVFTLLDSSFTRKMWDCAFKIEMLMRLGKTCELEIRVIESEKPTTAALHSYFFVDDITNVKVLNLGESYIDSLEKSCIKNSDGTLAIDKQVDRIYTHAKTTNVITENSKEKLKINHKNASDVVCWNPWFDEVKNIADMKESDVSKMICVESARIHKALMQGESLGVMVEVC